MSVAFIFNIILILLLIAFVVGFFYYKVKKAETKEEEKTDTAREREKYSIEKMQEFIKKQFDEITRMNLYDLALSEEEFERRKNVKYELKKALRGAGYADNLRTGRLYARSGRYSAPCDGQEEGQGAGFYAPVIY